VFNIPASFFGGFALADVTVDGDPVKVSMEKQSAEISLLEPLLPGKGGLVVLHFRQDLPPSDGRFGTAAGVVALGDWYPMLAVYDGAWVRTPYHDIGDPFYTDVADYDVFLATSSPVTVVATGEAISHSGRYWHFRARQARDFALAASARYSLVFKDFDGVAVTVAHLPEHAAAASQALEVAGESLRWYNTQVGKYPFASLAIAETVAQNYVHTAQEHSGLIFLRSDTVEGAGYYLDILSAHETAHQWFFGVVGSDQLREPWLDEGLANAMALDFFRQRDGDAYKSMWDGWGNYTVTGYLNRSILDFQQGTTYFDEVYRRGATFLRELQSLMGQADYWQALQAYYAGNRFAVATPAGFLQTMRAASATDPMPLYRRTFDYAFLSEPDPQVTVTLPSEVVSGLPLSVTLETTGTGIRFRARVDGQPVEVRQARIAVPGSLLSPGEHVLDLEAFGQGVSYARQTVRFVAVQAVATPTPLPIATPAPTPRPVLIVAAAAQPLAVTARDAVWRFLASLALALLIALVTVQWSGLRSAVKLLLLGGDEEKPPDPEAADQEPPVHESPLSGTGG
ncbi:MAG: M1 family metallopeptidase, partial [Chloroflexota bacterium]|nr:M1 family metallopeptidase [Chloroflexota bacterium]